MVDYSRKLTPEQTKTLIEIAETVQKAINILQEINVPHMAKKLGMTRQAVQYHLKKAEKGGSK